MGRGKALAVSDALELKILFSGQDAVSGMVSKIVGGLGPLGGLAVGAGAALIGIGATAAANLLQEFLIRKLTPHAPRYAPADQRK